MINCKSETEGMPPCLIRVIDFICTNIHRLVTVEEITEVSGVDHSTLYRNCMSFCGCPPLDLIRLFRLETIKEALENNPHGTVQSVLNDYGCVNQGRFAGLFRDQYGMSPHEALQEARRKNQAPPIEKDQE